MARVSSGAVCGRGEPSHQRSADPDSAFAAASSEWRRTPPEDRIQYLFKLKSLFEDHFDELSRMVTLENGKILAESRGEIRRAIENVEVACGIPTMMQGDVLEDATRGIAELVIRQPVGVCATIAPFNFPGMIPFWFLPYALACGNMASLFTTSGAAAREFRYEAQAGNIGINIGVAAPMAHFPFSGWKDSFFGVLHGQGKHAVEFFTPTKVVVERWPQEWSRQF